MELQVSDLTSFNLDDLGKKGLDNSPDCDTIILELQGIDKCYLAEAILSYDSLMSESVSELAYAANDYWNLIRNLWDAAYSHGFHDGQAECGVTLNEMED